MTMPKKSPLLPKEKVTVPLPERLSLSPEQASALTGIGISRIREAIRAGDLDAHRNGASIVILPDDIKVWLKALPAVEPTKNRP
jgi:excisionase family DNA binding protein